MKIKERVTISKDEHVVLTHTIDIRKGDVHLYDNGRGVGSYNKVTIAEVSTVTKTVRLEGDKSWMDAEQFLKRSKGRIGRMVKRKWYLPRRFVPDQECV
jgi:hypothetical protein